MPTDYEQLRDILKAVKQIQAKQGHAQDSMDRLAQTQAEQGNTLTRLSNLISSLPLDAILSTETKTLSVVDQILTLLTPAPIAGIRLTFGENNMAAKIRGASVDIQIPDDGSGNATATISFVDNVGNPTQAVAGATVATVATLSNPAITAAVDPTGLIVTLSPTPNPSGPPALATGVILSVSVTVTNPDGNVLGPFSATGATALDVVAGGPAGVQIQES